MTLKTPARPHHAASTSNFIRQIVEADLASKKHVKIRTRFPPEPNGYLHFGHAKSICLNFGLAEGYGGACNLRFDDTNPEKEEQEYVDSIIESVQWLGADFGGKPLYASDYFDIMYQCAEYLVTSGNAYVDSQSADEMKHTRGDFTHPGVDSPFRSRMPAENLELLKKMRAGEFPDGAHVLRAKIDMKSPNINMRDPAIYRIKRATHHRTGDKWCIYPMYTYAHPIEDGVEKITHSLCTLEFEDQRPFYDWLLGKLADGGLLERPLPQQIEFARLNLTYVVLSKRKLIQLVDEGHVDDWDDPRMPTLAGARRRGYTAEGFRRFAERIGVSKANQMIDYSVLEDCMREHLNEIAPRRMAVLDPVKLVIQNYPEGKEELMDVPNHPQKPESGMRQILFSRELWIEREDFTETPPKGYFRLFPGNDVRLRFGYVIKCIGYDAGSDTIRCTYYEDSRSGSPDSNNYKVKGNIHWLATKHAIPIRVAIYDRLFRVPRPGVGDRDFLLDINKHSVELLDALAEPSLQGTKPGDTFQFERYGYFTCDANSSSSNALKFNRVVGLRDSWRAYGTKEEPGKMPKVTEPDDELYLEEEPREEESNIQNIAYDISITNSDPTLDGIESMWKRGDLVIPDFQREFVWDIVQSSKLIESFLLGLPIPQIFLYTDTENKNLVIDGQQRVRSVIYFFEGYFGSETTQSRRQVFRLQGLDTHSPYNNKQYEDLDDTAKRKLRNASLHAVTIRQLRPADHTSIYHIFERLNTGGTALKPQEIRNCVYRGDLISKLRELNVNEDWRTILGKPKLDKHQKDIELILRILALSEKWTSYEKPMKEFLNKTAATERTAESLKVRKFIEQFPKVAKLIVTKLGRKPFHVRGPLNSSALDSVFCTVLDNSAQLVANLQEGWIALKNDKEFEDSTFYGTSDVAVLKLRFERARAHLVKPLPESPAS